MFDAEPINRCNDKEYKMISLQDMLNQQLGGNTLSQISQNLGTDENSTAMAIQAALPMLLGALARNSSNQEGAQALDTALSQDHDGGILDDIMGFLGNSNQGPGSGILGHIFGDRREAVEGNIAQSSGLNMSQIAQLLMILAPIVMGALGRTKRQEGLDAGGVADRLNQERQQIESSSPIMGMLSSLLDRDHDGSVMDDLASLGGGLLGNLMKGRQ
jgi:hypothetical protein